MVLPLIILFVIAPIAEIYVLLAAGGQFGVFPVLLACVATAIIGGTLLRIQGFAALREAQATIQAGGAPIGPLVDGLFLALCAPLMMTPGFITDAIGFTLLIPPVRRYLAKAAARWFQRKFAESEKIIIIDKR